MGNDFIRFLRSRVAAEGDSAPYPFPAMCKNTSNSVLSVEAGELFLMYTILVANKGYHRENNHYKRK